MSVERDRALLSRFEPVIHYTHGERFFPMDVEPYVRACSLWMHNPPEGPVCLVPEGDLTLERLAQPRAGGAKVALDSTRESARPPCSFLDGPLY